MLEHQWPHGNKPTRVVILGARGFLAAGLNRCLSAAGVQVKALGAVDLDLSQPGAGQSLGKQLSAEDSLVVMSAITPDKGRDVGAFMANMEMGRSVCEALTAKPVAHVIYISSDAVYPFIANPVNEETPTTPTDLYGTMHMAREVMISTAIGKVPYAILRPTMVLGATDSHNSYGPNRFRRQAALEGKITLGGEGEETRDHILVDDALALVELILRHRSSGLLNLATGHSISFFNLARMVASHFAPAAEVITTEHKFPVTHRKFDATAVHKAFPGFHFTALDEAVARTHAQAGALDKISGP